MNLGHRPGLVRAVAGAITAAIVLALGYELALGGGHKPIPLTGDYYDAIEVCPCASDVMAPMLEAAVSFRAKGVPTPSIALGDCENGPDRLVAQVRCETDVLTSHPAPFLPNSIDRIAHHRAGSAVAYIRKDALLPCSPAHILGHLSGLGHSTRARSVMHPRCGPSFDDVSWGPP